VDSALDGFAGSTGSRSVRLRRVNRARQAEGGEIDFYTSDELPNLSLDYGYQVAVGGLFGGGSHELVAEGMEAIASMLASGVTELRLVGFSRGAVIIAMILKELDKGGSG
jgi:hypothetical protein